ncbi:MAG: sulfatase [Rhodothermales bacterium]
MITNRLFHVLICTLFLISAGCEASKNIEDQHVESPPNIVFFYIDDLGWKDVGFNGSEYYETPHIDKMAEAGVIFTNAYANAPNCAPSRASLMTGMYAPRHKIYTVSSAARGKEENRRMIPVENNVTLGLEYVTLAEALQGAGYTTGHFGKWHLGDVGYFPEDQGFDVNKAGHHRGSPPGGHFSPYKNPTLTDGPEGEYLTDRLTNEALDFLDQSAGQPFFLYLTHYAVHTPIQGKEAITSKYKNKAPDGGQRNATYAAMIESMDESVGRVLDKIEALGETENTLVIFYSDNGGAIQATSNEPLRGYKGMLYEGGIRVPLAMKWPAVVPQGRENDTPVIGTDFYPTFAEIVGFEVPDEADGVSLASLMKGDSEIETRNLHWHFPAYLEKAGPMTNPWRTTPAASIRRGAFKLIEFFEDGSLELYNLDTDRGETTNLAEEMPGKVEELHQMMKQWREDVGADMPVMK